MLTDKAIKSAIAESRLIGIGAPRRLFDAGDKGIGGLYVEISPARGIARWSLKYRHGGKARRASFGVYPEVSIASARLKARDLRIEIDGGRPPHIAKERARTDTFATVSAEWFRTNRVGMAKRHAVAVERYLRYATDAYGEMGLADISPVHVLECLRELEANGKHETARRVRLYTSLVFAYAAATGRSAPFDPAAPLKRRGVLAPKPAVRNHPAMPFEHVAPWLRAFEKAPYSFDVKAALTFTVLTLLRTNETLGLRWADVADDNSKLTIPAERMKGKRAHTVFVSKPARVLLDALELINGREPGARVFPGRLDEELSNAAMAMALKRTCPKGVKATVHGFRATFSTWANTLYGGSNQPIVERCLAHVSGDKVAAAYNRATYDADAAKLWQQWADAISVR